MEKKYYFTLSACAKGKYYKEISVHSQTEFLNGIEGMSLGIMGSMGWSAEQVNSCLLAVTVDVKNTKIHCYVPMYVSPLSTMDPTDLCIDL